jgi:hypothetical protein
MLDASGRDDCLKAYFKIVFGGSGDGYARKRSRIISLSVFVNGKGSKK